MKVKYQFISKPDKKTLALVKGKMRADMKKALEAEEDPGAILLVQGTIPDMIYAADVAVKTSDVMSFEVVGNCPQSFITIAITGKIRSVQTALRAILAEENNERRNEVLSDLV